MASLANACRLSARLARRRLVADVPARGFRTSSAALAAQNFSMPALSPTMTEGNIATWRVKEGDKFVAGDVLLEIETDKATMDVEAQEDGIVMKIMQGDGSKGIQVGTRIAVIAEEGDDLSTLQIPPDEGPKPQAAKPTPEPSAASSQAAPAPREQQQQQQQPRKSGGKAPKQTYPLLPSVAHLMKENGLNESAVGDMTPTGPNGRLLKGDVLAYLGKINASTPSDVSARFEKAAHLDLSNIKVAKAPEPAKKPEAAPAASKPAVQAKATVTLNVSLAKALEVQKKVHDSVGVWLDLSTFVTRAVDLANEELPLPAGAEPSADELFNQVLGLDKIVGPRVSRGSYVPRVSSQFNLAPAPRRAPKDIIDILAGPAHVSAVKPSKVSDFSRLPVEAGDFSLLVPKAEARRAQAFLERFKTVLETEPGRLVL